MNKKRKKINIFKLSKTKKSHEGATVTMFNTTDLVQHKKNLHYAEYAAVIKQFLKFDEEVLGHKATIGAPQERIFMPTRFTAFI